MAMNCLKRFILHLCLFYQFSSSKLLSLIAFCTMSLIFFSVFLGLSLFLLSLDLHFRAFKVALFSYYSWLLKFKTETRGINWEERKMDKTGKVHPHKGEKTQVPFNFILKGKKAQDSVRKYFCLYVSNMSSYTSIPSSSRSSFFFRLPYL